MKELTTEQMPLVAILSMQAEIEVVPFCKRSGGIAFIVRGNIEPCLSDILRNKLIGVRDLLEAMQRIERTITILQERSVEVGGDNEG